jgi:perosamine synthetase
MRAIHHTPRAPLSLLFRRPTAAMREALAVAPSRFHFSRDALHAWFAKHRGVVWFPSFHCGMEVRAAVDAGCEPRFYRVREDFTIDEEHLAEGLSRERGAVVVIHYFGFAQPGIARIAALGAPLLEDCSHAFLSQFDGRPLGTFGDAATFSLYKSLGTVDGGALRDGGTRCDAAPALVALDAQVAAWQKRWRDRVESRTDVLRERFADRVVSARARIFDGPWSYGRAMSRLSLALSERIDPEHVAQRRRANYETLAKMIHADIPPLDDGTVPLFLPLFVEDRVAALVRLQAARIEPFIFGMFHHPAMREEDFPETRRLRENLLCLPVHHELRGDDLARIAEVLH